MLLTNDPNASRALAILGERETVVIKYLALIGRFLRHPTNWLLASRVVYTGRKSPEAVCMAVLRAIGRQPPEQ